MLTYELARNKVFEQVGKRTRTHATMVVGVWDALGTVLAQEVKSDREYPPFNRSTRDGYAVHSGEAAPDKQLTCVGEIKAGDTVTNALAPGTCQQIMTGAAVPPRTDAVVMIEHTSREGDSVSFDRTVQPGQNIVPKGSEAAAGQTILSPGMRLGYAELALAAQVGAVNLQCNKRPRVAILSTGDEVVLVDETPGPFYRTALHTLRLSWEV